MEFLRRARNALATDHTLQRVGRDGAKVARALPTASLEYLVEKVPVVHWLPRYNPRWILNDTLAGITVGVLLIPQGLAYAKIATIPGEFGLMSSWLPNFLYFLMGTSKDTSTGPTSLMGLLTAEIVRDISKEGFSPQSVASAVAMCVGIYCLVIGALKLGFLLEFVSIPVLNGFISAAGIVIMLGQIPSLFGVKAGTGTAVIIHDIFAQIPDYQGSTVGVGLGGILILVLMQKMGQRWGKKSKIIWFLALGRSAVVLILFTGISYGLNKNINLKKDDPLWELSKVKSNGIDSPKMPSTSLISKVFARSVAPFIAATIEHLAIAKGFGRKNNYVIDPAQELVYLGITNFFNSFFSSMPVGGAMSRAAVNSDTGVRSPVYGLIAGGVVVLSIFQLSPALFWIPKATLAAIIVTAVWHIIVPPKVFYGYWKTSLVDFVAAMLSFWLTLFVNSETGIGAAVGFNIAYHLVFSAFSRVRRVSTLSAPSFTSAHVASLPKDNSGNPVVPPDTQVFKFPVSIIYNNAYALKSQILATVQTHNSGSPETLEVLRKDRNWSVSHERKIRKLRAKAGITNEPYQISLVVLDLSMVVTIDTTALTHLRDLKVDLEKFGGGGTELRFAGVKGSVRRYFERFGWELYDADTVGVSERASNAGSAVYKSVAEAVGDRREFEPVEIMVVGDEKKG